MMRLTGGVTTAAAIMAATSLYTNSPALSANIQLAQVSIGGERGVTIGPKGITAGPQEKQQKEKCRTVTTTTETADGRKVTKKERICE